MDFRNTTALDSARLEQAFVRHTRPYRHDDLVVRVRYSRGAPYSGSCFYDHGQIFVNLGRHNRYPFAIGTHIARSQSNRTHWWRETFQVVVADAFQLALFVFLHEFYHFLVKRAGRNPRQKEGMCDRFATRVLVDHYRATVIDGRGARVARARWDFQDLDAFVAAAPRAPANLWEAAGVPAPRQIPVIIRGRPAGGGQAGAARHPRRGRAT